MVTLARTISSPCRTFHRLRTWHSSVSRLKCKFGTTGINTIRIYNPIKQGLDQDPKGRFVRQWVPELKDIDQEVIHTPWLSPNKPKGYPPPIVDEKDIKTNGF